MAPEFGKPIHQLPLVPANVLKKHRVHEPLDTRFRSAARLLQALWRTERDLPIGSYVNEDGKRRKLGSRIAEAAGKAGGNFLTPEIAHTARRETAYREIGALIDAERLPTNLLSSMPLTFNLLAPWGHAPERASGYLIELLPAFTGSARQLLFEHSPGHKRDQCGDFVNRSVAVERCVGLLGNSPIASGGIQIRVDRTRLDIVDCDAPVPHLSGQPLSAHLDPP